MLQISHATTAMKAFLFSIAFVSLLFPGVFASSAAEARPNIVFILVDDMGYGDTGPFGVPDARTPNLDRLAREGVRFTNLYANGPECTPSRTALITGRHPQRVGGMECAIGTGNVGRYDDAIRLAQANDLGLPVSHSVLGLALKQAGYATGIIGKWHLGYEPKFSPLNHGFDYFFGFQGGYVDYFRHREFSELDVFFQNREPVQRQGYLTHLLNDEAVAFIRRQQREPFFLYLAHGTPHFPFQAPQDDTGRMIPEEQLMTGTREKYVELLEDMDASVGQILQTLDDTGLAERTLLIFMSDHGAMKPGRNLPYSGFKGTLFEGGIRTPGLVRWPGRLKPNTTFDQVGMILDFTVSLLRIGGAKPPAGSAALDGIDLLQHVEQNRPVPNRPLFWRSRRGERTWWAARDGAMKYLRQTDGGQTEEWLFDLAADPAEQKNLLSSRPEVVQALKTKLAAWEKEVQPAR